jgi:glycolate oxidase FAD binding subunit
MADTSDLPAAGDGRDIEAELAEQVASAQEVGRALRILGGGTKDFYGRSIDTPLTLDVRPHRGVVAYEPTELAITVRAGTSLADVEALLAAHGQQFPFEPPHFGAAATIGGAVAAGLSGPRRPYAASLRDAVLGVRMINGRGQALSFGGRVMKNVAGYDVARAMAGSLGVLGVIAEVSLKVMPRPPAMLTLVREEPLERAIGLMREWAGRSLNVTATAWYEGRLYARLCGSDEALSEGRQVIGGDALEDSGFWTELREQRLEGFVGEGPLWRVSVAPATAPMTLTGLQVVEWGGALRWHAAALEPREVWAAARAAGGHASLFRAGGTTREQVFMPLDAVPLRLHRRLKHAFDPAGILNPGRMYAEI